MLEIKNLHVKLQEEDKVILRGVDLKIRSEEQSATDAAFSRARLDGQILYEG